MTEIAKASGIKREALYKALRSNSQPRLDTIQRVCKALGVKHSLVVTSLRLRLHHPRYVSTVSKVKSAAMWKPAAEYCPTRLMWAVWVPSLKVKMPPVPASLAA